MILYHMVREKYREVWPPQGTLHAEGRWNKPGQWIIYTAPSIALSKLETLANTSGLPVSMVCMAIEVPDNEKFFEIRRQQLPANWMLKPYPPDLHQFTKKFLNSDELLMKVPSAQSYREMNMLIKVSHPHFGKLVKLKEVWNEPFDGRLK
jgi:RES domain-containing protein